MLSRLFINLYILSSTNCTATFADSKVQTLLHSDWCKRIANLEGYSVTWLVTGWQFSFTNDGMISCAEYLELWLVAL